MKNLSEYCWSLFWKVVNEGKDSSIHLTFTVWPSFQSKQLADARRILPYKITSVHKCNRMIESQYFTTPNEIMDLGKIIKAAESITWNVDWELYGGRIRMTPSEPAVQSGGKIRYYIYAVGNAQYHAWCGHAKKKINCTWIQWSF